MRRAAALADHFYRASLAFAAQTFLLTERQLHRGVNCGGERLLVKATQPMFGVDQMIAGVELSIGLHHQVAAAAGAVHAAAAGMSEILRPRLFDIDNEHPPSIAALPPLSPDADHKTSPVIGAELVSFAQGRAFAHQRLKLQIARAEADQPVINRRRVGRHLVMHHHQQIKVHLMLMEQVNAAQRRRPGRPAAFIRTW